MRVVNWALCLMAVAVVFTLTGCSDNDGGSAQQSSWLAGEKVQQKVKLKADEEK